MLSIRLKALVIPTTQSTVSGASRNEKWLRRTVTPKASRIPAPANWPASLTSGGRLKRSSASPRRAISEAPPTIASNWPVAFATPLPPSSGWRPITRIRIKAR